MRWRNREGINASEYASTAGDYYVALALSRDEQDESYLVPFTLTVDAIGEAGRGAPTYRQAPSTAEPETSEGGEPESTQQGDDATEDPGEATQDAAAEGDAAPTGSDEVVPGAASAAGSDGVPTAVLISLGVVGLVVLTIGALGVFRVLSR